MIKVRANDLADALEAAKPHLRKKPRKPIPVSLEYDSVTEMLTVVEAKFGMFSKSITFSGEWPKSVQVDGIMLYRLVSTWPPDTELEVSSDTQNITIRAGKAVFHVSRIDGGGTNPIQRITMKPNKRHKGKVEVVATPESKRVELADTWAFSARVPVPHHRIPKE